MRKTLSVLWLFCSLVSFSQKIDTSVINCHGNRFYHITSGSNSKILVFLHGGVNNPVFDNPSAVHDLHFILEGNKSFIVTALANKFDLLIPITNDSLNWLTNHQYVFQRIQSCLASTKPYDAHYISGFSDGGTGSYKIFYDNTGYFAGLAVFNGYPQHHNFYRKVHYETAAHQAIVFFSTFNDKVIPYEFLLTEYCKQKKSNPNTFLYVTKGGHSFAYYSQKEINICFDVLTSKLKNTKNEAIHAYMENDTVIEFYPFRRKISKKYGYGVDYYEINQAQQKMYKK